MAMMGSAGGGPTNFGGTINRDRFGTANNTATAGFDNDGNLYIGGTGTVVADTISADHWYFPNAAGVGPLHWIRATLSSGSTPTSGTMNTWTSLTSAQQWTNNSGGGSAGNRTSTILFEISTSSGGSPVVCSGTVTITASHEL